ncbi:unnamed protein product [Clavelina lepadiformis]|uniref:Transcription factor AP-2 C-terminal domain-containing protein n=2 Tax=Clavelina lepadiformis TaxID=159417 RepID=A0ABP0H1J8_CLALP
MDNNNNHCYGADNPTQPADQGPISSCENLLIPNRKSHDNVALFSACNQEKELASNTDEISASNDSLPDNILSTASSSNVAESENMLKTLPLMPVLSSGTSFPTNSSTSNFTSVGCKNTVGETDQFEHLAKKRCREDDADTVLSASFRSPKKTKWEESTNCNQGNDHNALHSFPRNKKTNCLVNTTLKQKEFDGLHQECQLLAPTSTWQPTNQNDVFPQELSWNSENKMWACNRSQFRWPYEGLNNYYLNQTLLMPAHLHQNATDSIQRWEPDEKVDNSHKCHKDHIASSKKATADGKNTDFMNGPFTNNDKFASTRSLPSSSMPVLHNANKSDFASQHHEAFCMRSDFCMKCETCHKMVCEESHPAESSNSLQFEHPPLAYSEYGKATSLRSRQQTLSYFPVGNDHNARPCATRETDTYDNIVKGLPRNISPNDVFCLVPGRLGMPNQGKKHKVLVGEIVRRVLTPESLNISLLGPILRKAKSKNGSQYLRQKLHQIGVELPQGRRKTAQCTLFTSLTESESFQLAGDFTKLCEETFPSHSLARYVARRGATQPNKWSFHTIQNTINMVREFTELLDPNVFECEQGGKSVLNSISTKQQMYNFETLTHGFGLKAISSSLATFHNFLTVLAAVINTDV